MIVVPHVFSRRFLTQGVLQRPFSASYLRYFSSGQDGDDNKKKETSMSMLLKSLKQREPVKLNADEESTTKNDATQKNNTSTYEFTVDTQTRRDRTKPISPEMNANLKSILSKLKVDTDKSQLSSVLQRESVNAEEESTPQKDATQKKHTSNYEFTVNAQTKRSKHGVQNTMAKFFNRDRTKPVSPEMNANLKSILSKLKVGTAKSQLSRDIEGAVKSWGRKITGEQVAKDFLMQSRPESVKVSEAISFASQARFEGFDDIFKGGNLPFKESLPGLKLLEGEDRELLEKQKSLDQRNDFLTLIEIADKQWKFPVDNEVCKVEEENVGFEEHIFLGYLLDGFPKKGPVRRFMELVVNGLEQNPYMTVEHKKNQVYWFKDYFENIPEEDLSF